MYSRRQGSSTLESQAPASLQKSLVDGNHPSRQKFPAVFEQRGICLGTPLFNQVNIFSFASCNMELSIIFWCVKVV